MEKISIADLIPGMIAAEDILSHDNQVVVPKGVVFTENIIARLENYCIYYANVEEHRAGDLSHPLMQQTAAADIVGLYAADKSADVQRFTSAYRRCSEHYCAILTGSISRNEPFSYDDFLREVLSLLYQDGEEINVFDMLLRMHNMDDSVYDHCIDVALISNIFSKWLGFSEDDQRMATACGLFHDVGKLMLPVGILRKPGKLTHDEFNIIKTHPVEGFHLLNRYQSIPEPVKNAALMHHEKCDGSGYPYGLREEEISRFAKLVTIVDIFDAMTSERVYRSAMCPFSVIKYFEDDGIQKYDTKYILTFLENVSNAYLNHKVMLSNGMSGNVVFINRDSFSKPVIRTQDNEIVDLQNDHYNSILMLSKIEQLSIEAII